MTLDSGEEVTQLAVNQRTAGSNPACPATGARCSGSTSVSKTEGDGSIPSASARLTPQQAADLDLAAWQDGRKRGLTPEQRMEELFFDFLIPPTPCEVEYEVLLRKVRQEMAA